MQVEQLPITDVIPYENNPRKNKQAIAKVADSLREYGWRQPIVVDAENVVIVGHTRLLAAQKLGMGTVPVLVAADLTKEQAKAYRIADNRTGEEAEWDMDLLTIELRSLDDIGFQLDLTGFDSMEIDAMFNPSTRKGSAQDDDVPDDVEALSALGDVWQLGKHRLIVGDCTDMSVVEKCMNGAKADIVLTSPPYNVGKTPNGNKRKYLSDTDNKPASVYSQFLIDFTNIGLMFADYVFVNIQSVAGNKKPLICYLYEMKDRFADTIIWDKLTAEPAMAKRVLNSRFEYVHVFSKEAKRAIGKQEFRGTCDNVIALNSKQDKKFSKLHKAVFPVSFASFFIDNFTKSSCLDLFAGTGTTLIACEKANRQCFMVELDPHYADVIIRRWQDYTDEEAVKLEKAEAA